MTKTTKRQQPRRRNTKYIVASFSLPVEWRTILRRRCARSHMTFSRTICDALRPIIEGAAK